MGGRVFPGLFVVFWVFLLLWLGVLGGLELWVVSLLVSMASFWLFSCVALPVVLGFFVVGVCGGLGFASSLPWWAFALVACFVGCPLFCWVLPPCDFVYSCLFTYEFVDILFSI